MEHPRITTRNEAIANDYREGQSVQQLMDTYDLSYSRITQLIWQAGISGDTRPHLRGEQHPMCRYPDTLVAAVRQAKLPGVTYATLATRFGMSISYIWFIVNGKARAA